MSLDGTVPTSDELRAVERLQYCVNLTGGMLTLDVGRLRVIQPSGGLAPTLRSAIVEHKKAIVFYLQHGRELSPEESERLERTRDPRALDYSGDTCQWVWLFAAVYDDPALPADLLGALNLIRCYGARLIRFGAGCRIDRGDCPHSVYDSVRRDVLAPYVSPLRRLLREMPVVEVFFSADPVPVGVMS